MAIRILSSENITGDITTSGKVNAGDRILTEATTSNALLQVKYNASNYLEAYYNTLNVVGGDFLVKRAGDTKIRLTAVGTTFTNLSNTSAASSSVDEVKIGTFGAGRPAIFLGSSNTTYSNSTWFIENIGASGKFRIGRNGLDILEIENSGASTFKATSVTVLHASDPSVAVSDTDTNYKGIMTWRNSGSENVLDFVTRYGGTYYTKNLVLDRGKVGIGTYLPTTALTVRKSISPTAYGGEASMIEFKSYYTGYDTETVKSAIYSGVSDQTTLQTTKGFMSFWTADEVSGGGQSLTEKMRIESNGKVGIGTISPGYTLEIAGPSTTSFAYQRTGVSANKWGFHSDNDATYWQNLTSGGLLFTLQNGGNVGINKTNPGYKLHARGGSATEETVLKIDKNATADSGGHTTILGFGTESGNWAKAGIGFERTGSYDVGKMHFLMYPTGLNTNTVTLAQSVMTINNNSFVGIGTTSPQGKLDSVAPAADLTDFGRATGSALNIRIANVVGHLGQINFCNDAAPAFGYGSIGMVMTNGSGVGLGDMVFGTKSSGSAVVSTERMRIDSNGSIGMGANSSSYRLRVKSDATVDNGIYLSAGTGSGNHSLYVENKDATAEFFAVRGDGEIRFNATSGHTFANTGIRFGTNAAANNLDYYEEGTWTPVIAHNDGTGVVPLTPNAARYIRVGDLVYISCYLTFINPNGNAGGAGAYYGIRGFPFTPENYGAWQIVYASTNVTAYGGYSSTASLYFMSNGTNGQRSQNHVNGAQLNAWGSNNTLMMNCVYNING
jgi:hypothetical protein